MGSSIAIVGQIREIGHEFSDFSDFTGYNTQLGGFGLDGTHKVARIRPPGGPGLCCKLLLCKELSRLGVVADASVYHFATPPVSIGRATCTLPPTLILATFDTPRTILTTLPLQPLQHIQSYHHNPCIHYIYTLPIGGGVCKSPSARGFTVPHPPAAGYSCTGSKDPAGHHPLA